MTTPSMPTVQPWWRYGHVWLIISGPLLVVIAGFVTAYIAIRNPDPVIAEDYYRQGLEINQSLKDPTRSMAPAHQARNHAATPQDVPLQRKP
jgi:hypothetical protein